MSERRPVGGPTSGTVFGKGPFEEGISHSRKVSWLAVALMVVGFALLGLAVVLVSVTAIGAIVAAVCGVVLGCAGAVTAWRGHILQDVE